MFQLWGLGWAHAPACMSFRCGQWEPSVDQKQEALSTAEPSFQRPVTCTCLVLVANLITFKITLETNFCTYLWGSIHGGLNEVGHTLMVGNTICSLDRGPSVNERENTRSPSIASLSRCFLTTDATWLAGHSHSFLVLIQCTSNCTPEETYPSLVCFFFFHVFLNRNKKYIDKSVSKSSKIWFHTQSPLWLSYITYSSGMLGHSGVEYLWQRLTLIWKVKPMCSLGH